MTNPKNFRPHLSKAQVNLILNSLIDRREFNPPVKGSVEFRNLETLIFQFETMEDRSNYLISRRAQKGAPHHKGTGRPTQ
jgi:hypothetical protein